MTRYRLAVDTGGTFSDFVLFDEEAGEYRVLKVPSTPDDPARAVMHGLEILTAEGVRPEEIDLFSHGTTVATNALLEERGARAGLAITAGFRAVYETMEQVRPYGPTVFDLGFEKPSLLAPQSRTAEIRERIGPRGEVRLPLDDSSVAEAIARLEAEQVESVAICFLFSFMNPDHERRVRDAFRRAHPEWSLSASSDLLPQIREYYRLSTTVINAYVAPVLARYVGELDHQLDQCGVAPGRRFTMQSNGGSAPFASTPERAVATILSGPAGGVMAGARLAEAAGIANVITFDMGGTSCDVALIQDGEPTIAAHSNIGGRDLAVPMLDINTVSAGGGTLAYVDGGGALHVGPRSAGAAPGPACYGRGATMPAVTDADLVLGYLGPRSLLGGALEVDVGAAERALLECVAQPLGVDLLRAADGVVRVVNVKMAEAIKAISTQRGFDLRDFTLVPFGGAGPVHACQIALDLGIPRVLVPPVPGVTSALGLLMSDVKHDYVRSRLACLDELTANDVSSIFGDLASLARAQLRAERFGDDSVRLRYLLEMRYAGQGYEMPVAVDRVPLLEDDLRRYRERFDELHRRRHGHAAPGQPVEVVNYRVEATGLVSRVDVKPLHSSAERLEAVRRGERQALFPSLCERPVAVSVYGRERLRPGHTLSGPAIVEQYDATTVICPEQQAVVDRFGNLVVTEAGACQ